MGDPTRLGPRARQKAGAGRSTPQLRRPDTKHASKIGADARIGSKTVWWRRSRLATARLHRCGSVCDTRTLPPGPWRRGVPARVDAEWATPFTRGTKPSTPTSPVGAGRRRWSSYRRRRCSGSPDRGRASRGDSRRASLLPSGPWSSASSPTARSTGRRRELCAARRVRRPGQRADSTTHVMEQLLHDRRAEARAESRSNAGVLCQFYATAPGPEGRGRERSPSAGLADPSPYAGADASWWSTCTPDRPGSSTFTVDHLTGGASARRTPGHQGSTATAAATVVSPEPVPQASPHGSRTALRIVTESRPKSRHASTSGGRRARTT